MPLLTFIATVGGNFRAVVRPSDSTGGGLRSRYDGSSGGGGGGMSGGTTKSLMLVALMDVPQLSDARRKDTLRQQAKAILKKVTTNSPQRMSYDTKGGFVFHYAIKDGICVLILAERSYPRRLAFTYINEIHDQFEMYVRKEHADAWLDHIRAQSRPYKFIHFDKTIGSVRRKYIDPSTRQNMAKLQGDLQDIQSIMKKNIDEVLERGQKLEDTRKISENLVDQSKSMKWGARRLNLEAQLKKYLPMVVVGLVVVGVLYYKLLR